MIRPLPSYIKSLSSKKWLWKTCKRKIKRTPPKSWSFSNKPNRVTARSIPSSVSLNFSDVKQNLKALLILLCCSAFSATDRWSPSALLWSRCREQRQSQRQCDLPFDPLMLRTAHGTALTCQKCCGLYEACVKLTPNQVEKKKSTHKVCQSCSKARGSLQMTAKKVPKRNSINPGKFLNQHLWMKSIFWDDPATTATRMRTKQFRLRGYVVERKVLLGYPLIAAPGGVLRGTPHHLLSFWVSHMLSWQVVFLKDGQFLFCLTSNETYIV